MGAAVAAMAVAREAGRVAQREAWRAVAPRVACVEAVGMVAAVMEMAL